MKKIILILLVCSSFLLGQQTEQINSVTLSNGGSYDEVQAAIVTSTPFHEVLIYAVDSNATSSAIPSWFSTLTNDLEQFFEKATFNNLDYSISLLTKSGEAFRFAYGDTCNF